MLNAVKNGYAYCVTIVLLSRRIKALDTLLRFSVATAVTLCANVLGLRK
jgi:hypothetical protein